MPKPLWLEKYLRDRREKRRAHWTYQMRYWDTRLRELPHRDVLGRFISPADYKSRNDYQDREIAALKEAVRLLLSERNSCNCGK